MSIWCKHRLELHKFFNFNFCAAHSPVRLDIETKSPCSASDRLGSNFESCVWRTVSSQSSHHPQEVLLAQFSLYVHKGGLKPDSFHFYFRFLIIDNHVKNRKYGNFVSISSLTGECAADKLKNFCSSSLWTCLHHMVILGIQNKITDFFMILAWASPFKDIT